MMITGDGCTIRNALTGTSIDDFTTSTTTKITGIIRRPTNNILFVFLFRNDGILKLLLS